MLFFSGAINSTAHKIEVNTYKPPPPPTLKDYINPKVGDKIYDTDNRFVQEWLTGMCVCVYYKLTYYRILGLPHLRKTNISDGSNSTILFIHTSFTHRRLKTLCVLLIRLAEFISTIQYVYHVTRISIEPRKSLVPRIIASFTGYTSPSLLAYIAIPRPETQRDTYAQASVS